VNINLGECLFVYLGKQFVESNRKKEVGSEKLRFVAEAGAAFEFQ